MASLIGSACSIAHAQLAVTEVMSRAAQTYLGTNKVAQNPDFWELTNFGTNATDLIDLAGYTFKDAKSSTNRYPLVGQGDAPLSIGPGESILFACTTAPTTNEFQFREWWGPCLSPAVKVRFYGANPGLSGTKGDGIRLYDPAGAMLDAVDFGVGQPGVTFTYDTNGVFGVLSGSGMGGVCRAATADDVGSPGVTSGPVPLRILEQPVDQTVNIGTQAVLVVRVGGLPKPRYQWRFNGQSILGAIGPELILPEVRPDDAGEYEVELNNGLMKLQSRAARLTVSSSPRRPEILAPPMDLQVFAGQRARFSTTVAGYPPPEVQWFCNELPLPGETGTSLVVEGCELDLANALYCVEASNAAGSARACARLSVIPWPDIRVTEIMADPVRPGENWPGRDWFELTNYDTNTIHLRGWRFCDQPNLQRAWAVTQAMSVRPGESVIFVRTMTAGEFASWWGPENLPGHLQIVTWSGGIGLAAGESLFLWNAAAEDVDNDLFGAYTSRICQPAISLEPVPGWPARLGCDSVPGQNGAFPAAQGGATGSPGYVQNPELRFLSIQFQEEQVLLRWRAVTGRNYLLWCKDTLSDETWQRLGPYPAKTATVAVEDSAMLHLGQRFYRLEQLP